MRTICLFSRLSILTRIDRWHHQWREFNWVKTMLSDGKEDLQIVITRSLQTLHEDFLRLPSMITDDQWAAMNEFRSLPLSSSNRSNRSGDWHEARRRQTDRTRLWTKCVFFIRSTDWQNNETEILDRSPIQQFNLLAKSWSDRRIDSADVSIIEWN